MKKLMFFSIGIITSLVMSAQVQLTETNCSNGIDDDGDGLIDCIDPDCISAPDCASLNNEPVLKGVAEGTGSYFVVTNSDYLNITLASSADITIFLSSVPQMISMNISRPASTPAPYEATLTITGLLPSTIYYKYNDSYHNSDSITTDANGSYAWTQDLTEAHHVWIQPTRSTIFICDDATGCGCTTVGTWDNVTKTCTLTIDVTETIQIDSPGITLDGNGHRINGAGTGYGIYVSGKNNVTIKNCVISNFTEGIRIQSGSNNTLSNNNINSNGNGVFLNSSLNNAISYNTISLNGYGIFLYSGSDFINLDNNNVSYNDYSGIYLSSSSNNNITNNTLNSNYSGISGFISLLNIITGNTVSFSSSYGIHFNQSSNNNLTNNVANSNSYGIYLQAGSGGNTVVGNATNSNSIGIYIFSCSDNNITDNIAIGNGYSGLILPSVSNSTIDNNTILNNSGFGLIVSSGSYNNITNNNVSFNIQAGIQLSQGSNNSVNGNTASNNNTYGIRLDNITNSNILNNTVESNSTGIYLYNNTDNNFMGNNIFNNVEYGIYLQTCQNNTIGGISAQQLNTITNNGISGIYLIASNGIKISGNIIYGNPIAIKNIDGSNNNKAIPVISSFDGTTLTGISEPNDTIEIFGSTGDENANEFLITVHSDSNGEWTTNMNTTFEWVVATATSNNNTSVLSNSFHIETITTQIIDKYFGAANLSSLDTLYAEIVSGVSKYEFHIKQVLSGYNVSYSNNQEILPLGQIQGLLPDRIYEVKVRVIMQNGTTMPYGKSSTFSMTSNKMRIDQHPKEYFNGDIYSDGLSIRTTDNSIIPAINAGALLRGTRSIADSSLKSIFDSYILSAGGNLDEVRINRINYDSLFPTLVYTHNIYRIRFPVVINISSFITDLMQLQCIAEANPPYSITLFDGVDFYDTGSANNPGYSLWHIDKIQAPNAWVFTQNLIPQSATVSIIEAAEPWRGGRVKPDHVEFINPNRIGNLADYNPCGEVPFEGERGEHATRVASVIASNPSVTPPYNTGTVSVGFNLTKVNSHAFHSLFVPTDCAYLDYDNGFQEYFNTLPLSRFVNLSWGFQDNIRFYRWSEVSTYMAPIQAALDNDVMVFAATGNDMTDMYGNSLGIRGIGYPFGLRTLTNDVIGVGGTAPNDPAIGEYGMGSGPNSGLNANYNYYNSSIPSGSEDDINQSQGFLEITAPGWFIDVAGLGNYLLINDYYDWGRGTSFSSPMVATVASVMADVNPTLTNDDIRRILFETADKVNYNPNGLQLLDLNGTASYQQGYQYSNPGIGAGGFINTNIDFIMGYGRVNMLSAIMNAAGLSGFTVNSSMAFHNVTVNNVNNQSYLTGTYNESYEYDAVLNQQGANLTFNDAGTTFELSENSTFRMSNGAELYFNNNAGLIIQPGNGTEETKFIIEQRAGNGGTLYLADNIFIFPNQTLIEVNENSTLNIDNATVVIQDGATIHIKNGATLNINTNGILTFDPNSYICIEPGAIVNITGTLNFSAAALIGVSPILPNSGICQNPCDIPLNPNVTITGAYNYDGNCLVFESGTTISNVICNTPNSGSISVVISGGLPPYSYQWSSNAGSQTTSIATGLSAGVYSVTVADQINNTLTGTFTVLASEQLNLAINSTNIINCNFLYTTGSAFVSVTGGTPPFTFLWDDPNSQTTQTATNLLIGTYHVTVTDNNGCSAMASVDIIQDSQPIAINPVVSNVSCLGGNNGEIVFNISGGTQGPPSYWGPNYLFTTTGTYVGTGGGLTPTFSDLSAGDYIYYFSDAAGCHLNIPVTINEPSTLFEIVDAFQTNVSCLGGNDGNATILVAGGDAPYTFLWDINAGSQTANTATGLSSGNYSVTATDANGCQISHTFIITEPFNSIVLVTNQNNVLCNGYNDGSATVIISGGTPPYDIIWDAYTGNQITETAIGLTVGTYFVTVTDDNGDCASTSVTITQTNPINITFNSTNSTCDISTDGSATVFPTSGLSPYEFIWDSNTGSQVTQTANNLTIGNYSVTVSDANGCSTSGNVNVIADDFIVTIAYTNNPICFGNGGSIVINTIQGGTQPYSYQWGASANFQTTQTAVGLVGGWHSFTVTDANGCVATCQGTCKRYIFEPDEIILTHTSVGSTTCVSANGQATVNILSGGISPFTYLWNDPASQNSPTANNLLPGTYIVTVTDNNNCTAIEEVTINQPPNTLSVTAIADNYNPCVPADIFALPTGGNQPYTFLWNDINNQTTQIATGLNSGSYNVTVTDNIGCTAISSTINISTLIPISPTISGNLGYCSGINTTLDAGAGYSSYLWSTGSVNQTINATIADNPISVTVTDANGCTSASPIVNVYEYTSPSPMITGSPGFGYCTGSSAFLSVGFGSFASYLWSSGVSTPTINATIVDNPISVTVTDINGCTGISPGINVIENPLPSPVISGSLSYCSGTSTILSTGSGYISFFWSTGSTTNTTNVTASDNPVNVTVTDINGCTGSSVSVNVTENVLPSVYAGSDISVCANTQITLSGSGATSYVWDNSVLDGVPFTPPVGITTYTVTGTDNNGCTASDEVVVTVNSLPVVSAGSDLTICDGSQITLSGSGATSYVWDNGVTNGIPFTPPVGITTYTVTGTDNNGCTAIDEVVITVNPLPVVSAGSDLTVCEGTQITLSGSGATSYVWDNGVTNGVPFTPPVGISTYTVTGTDDNGCTESDEVVVTVNPLPIVSAGADLTVCEGTQITLSGSGATSYVWDNGVTNGIPFTPPVGVTPYTVTGTDVNGCTANDEVVVTVNPLPIADAGNDQTILCGESAVLTASGGVSYEWDNGAVTASITVSPVNTTTYSVIVTNSFGCSATDDVTVTVNSNPPAANFTFPQYDNIENYPVTFTISNYNSNNTYSWDWFDGTSTLNSTNPTEIHTFPYPGYYNVTLTAFNASCGTSSLSQIIYIIPNEGSYAPTPGCLSSFSYDYTDLEISSSVTWNTSGTIIYIKGTLTIKPDGSLSVSNGTTVAFGPQGKVVVEAAPPSGILLGGKLIINNASFTGITFTNCNGNSVKMMWQGIEVHGNPSSTLEPKQGGLTLNNGALIEDAYNGITLGKHKLVLNFAGNGFKYDANDHAYGGGVVKATASNFNRCCVGIKFFGYNFSSSYSFVSRCRFICKTSINGTNTSLLDPYFLEHYPHEVNEYYNPAIALHNPFYNVYFSTNLTGRTIKGIDIFERKKLILRDNTFEHCEAGICGTNAQLLSIIKGTGAGNTFSNVRIGIKLANTTLSITNNFTISNSSFRNFVWGCILATGMNATVQKNNFNYPYLYPQLDNEIGVTLLSTRSFNVTDNNFGSLKFGVQCSNSGNYTSLIGFQTNGNVFSRCRWPIQTTNNNSMLNIRCNNFDNDLPAYYSGKNWDIFGSLHDQGQSGTTVKDPAGNRFNQALSKQIDANTSQYFNYWPHTTPITIPSMFSVNSTLNIMTGAVPFPANIADACTPLPLCPPPCNDQILLSYRNMINLLMQEYVNVQNNLDNGQTTALLSAIESNLSAQSLKNMLVSNSPLSDTVIFAFINRSKPTPPPFFRDVIIPNSPVSENVLPVLNNKLVSIPKPFAEQISQAQAENGDYRTLTSIKREIAGIENERQTVVSNTVRYYLDNDSVDYAINVLEQENEKDIVQGLVGVYLNEGNLSSAITKLNSLPVSTPDDIAFRNLYTLFIDLSLQQKTIWDIDNEQYLLVKQIASMCPASVATLNAQEVLFRIEGEKFEPCPENIIARYSNNNTNPDIQLNFEEIEYLGNNIPNPFRTTTTIPYFIPSGSIGVMTITDIDGRQIKTYELSEGSNKLEVSLEGYGNGMYFYTLNIDVGRIVRYKKMILNW